MGAHTAPLMLVALVVGSRATGAHPVAGGYRAETYVAQWTAGTIEMMSLSGERLLSWPVGAACAPADPAVPLDPSPAHRAEPRVDRDDQGGLVLTWRWRFPPPHAFCEQIDMFRLLPRRIEARVGVRWRIPPTRLVRLVYGGRMAARCYDLEGLWLAREPEAHLEPWLLVPVPGVFQGAGRLTHRRAVRLGSDPQVMRLILGGVDEDDQTLWDGLRVGETAANAASLPWTIARRYDFATGREPGPDTHVLAIIVHNSEGQGGLWRGPCVLGPPDDLDTSPLGDGWTRVYPHAVKLHHWCPDDYERSLTGRFTVSLTSVDRTREMVPENVTTGGRFLLPPYLVALEGEHGWAGLATLDLPRAEDGLRIEWRDGGLTCPFLLATDPDTHAYGWTFGPRLGILSGASRRDILNGYLQAVPPRSGRPRPAWWSGPEYCTWGDQCYASQECGSDVGSLTEERVRAWLSTLAEKHIEAPLVVLDAGWWQLSQGLVDELHRQGRHVVLWTQPHWQPDTSRHAEWAMRDSAGRPLSYDPNNWILDYTRADVRAHIAEALASYVTASGWNADGIKLDFPYTAAPVWALHADPSWGAGEQYRARVLQFIYSTVKSHRPDALVTLGCANPLFGDVQDVCRLNEDWFDDPDRFRRRAEVVLSLGQWVNCDDWNAYEHYLDTQAVERPVWGTFTLMSAAYRGDHANRRIPLSAEWARRLSAITRLAKRAPVLGGQKCTFDAATGITRREAADGTLVAAALRLSGSDGPARVLVVRAGRSLLMTATASGPVAVPAPWPVARVEAVSHGGSRRRVPFRAEAGELRLEVEDAAGDVSHYEVVPQPEGAASRLKGGAGLVSGRPQGAANERRARPEGDRAHGRPNRDPSPPTAAR